MTATHSPAAPLPAVPVPRVERVRITVTRMRQVAAAAVALDNALDRLNDAVGVLLVGRETGNGGSTVVDALKRIQTHVENGEVAQAADQAKLLAAEFEAMN